MKQLALAFALAVTLPVGLLACRSNDEGRAQTARTSAGTEPAEADARERLTWVARLKARGLQPSTILTALTLRDGALSIALDVLEPAAGLPEGAELEEVVLVPAVSMVCDGYGYSVLVAPEDGTFWIRRQGGIGGRIHHFGPGSIEAHGLSPELGDLLEPSHLVSQTPTR